MNNIDAQNSYFAAASGVDGFLFGASLDGRVAVSSGTTVVDAELLFSGSYNRIGTDLVISNETSSITIPEYFKGENRSALMSPEGASLSGKAIEAMTARAQYAQADQIASAVPAVGNVAKVAGSAVVTRNGVSVDLVQGDRLLKGDVVQTGADATLAISFVDGTALGLASHARIVLDEMVYDPKGSSNSSLLSLVQGTVTLVAGHTAKFGNMRVETPVATMGIRGTAVLVEIAADGGPTRFSVLSEPDGKTGAFDLYDKNTGELIRVVSHAGLVTLVSPQGVGLPVSAVEQLKTLGDLQSEKSLIQQVFQIYFPNYSPDGRTGSSSNPLAAASVGDTQQAISSGVPGLMALAGSVAIIPVVPTVQDILIFADAPPAVTAIAVVNVVDVQATQGQEPVERNFAISDQVTITVDGQVIEDPAGRYVPGSGVVTTVAGTASVPPGVSLADLVHVDATTGVVTYDPSDFAFLGAGESAIYTIGFTSRSGASVVPETLTLTINGLNDAPTVEHAIPDQRIRDGCRFEYVIPASIFADLDANDTLTYRATLANGDPLPGWLTFDPVTLTFSGTPPKGEDCVLHLAVIASDEHDAAIIDRFDLVIVDDHHHKHHDWFDRKLATDVSVKSHESDVAVGDDLPHGLNDDASGNEATALAATETWESNSHGHACACDTIRTENEDALSSKAVVSSSDEYRSQSMASHRDKGSDDLRPHELVHTAANTVFVADEFMGSGRRTDLERAVAGYSNESGSANFNLFASNHHLTFTWSYDRGSSHRDMSAVDGFVFRPDAERDRSESGRSSPAAAQIVDAHFETHFNIEAFVHVMAGIDSAVAHGEQGVASFRQVALTEMQTHLNDFQLI